MSFFKWFATMIATRLFIGVPLELLCYVIFFGGSLMAAALFTPVWHVQASLVAEREAFLSNGTNLYFFWITAICGAFLILAVHLNLWFFLIRVGTKSMLMHVLGPLGFELAYLAGAFGGKLVGEYFFPDLSDAFYDDRAQIGMVLGAVLLGGIYLLGAMIFMYAQQSYYLRNSQSATVVERAKERVLR